MTQAVVTRRDGDVFQARMFWLHAARLLDEHSPIIRVGFESGPKGFDDIWVEYDPARAPQDPLGNSLSVERMQCKWHATPGVFTHENLVQPDYINATSTSFLQRALEAHRADRAAGIVSRFVLVTNHLLSPVDPLSRYLRSRSLCLNVEGLFEGTTARSATGKLRRLWREHLGVDDYELRGLCTRMGFNLTRDSLDAVRSMLDEVCRANGLTRPEPNASSTIYDSNVFDWVGQRRASFDRKAFRDKCAQEGLLAHQSKPSRCVFGLKSFEHPLDRLENRCAEVLNLVSEFDERVIRDPAAWHGTLVPRIREFLIRIPTPDGRLLLAIEAHATLAFAAGVILDTKSGRLVEIEQRTPVLRVWAADDEKLRGDAASWEFREHALDPTGQGTACAVSLTRDTEGAVRRYIDQSGRRYRRLIVAQPRGGPSATAVASGSHANYLAEKLAAKIAFDRDVNAVNNTERYHFFISAPNAFTFYLGRQAAVLKPLTLYEFDFGNQVDGSYQPSISYPDVSSHRTSERDINDVGA